MSRIRVDLAAVDELIARMQRFEAGLVELRAEAAARTEQLHSTWNGTAAHAQALAQGRWAAGAGEVHEALVALRSVAGTAHANYTAAVLANRRMWSR
jgi:WXG100 family type VII secretion target